MVLKIGFNLRTWLHAVLSCRLWHQLTVKLQTFVHHQHFKQDGLLEVSCMLSADLMMIRYLVHNFLIQLYEMFIEDFEHK